MILTVLGCSGSVPGPGVPCSGYLVEHDGHRLLLDLGTGAFGALLEYAAADAVDTVVLSHRHADHAADLSALAYAQAAGPGRVTPTRVIAPAGAVAGVRRAELFAVEDAAPGELTCGPLRIRLARVRHSVETYAVRVEAGGQSLTYTADSAPCAALAALSEGTGLLLAEAALGPGGPAEEGALAARGAAAAAEGGRSTARGAAAAAEEGASWGGPDAGPGPQHLTARQAGELAALSGAAVLVVTHVRPWDDGTACLTAAAAAFPGPTLLARPGLRVAPAGALGTARATRHGLHSAPLPGQAGRVP